jgi:hypothetical protein
LVLAGCGGDDGVETLLEVIHVKGFQGVLSSGSLMEIEVADVSDGEHSFTLYIGGEKKGTGTLILFGGSIMAIKDCTDTSLTYSEGVRYSGIKIPMREADDTVWVHWGVYLYGTMGDFETHANRYGRDADRMYDNRPPPYDEGYYSYDTPQNIFDKARRDYPEDAPPFSVLNQAIRVLNDHRNTGVGAYVSRGNLIAYYLKRVRD